MCNVVVDSLDGTVGIRDCEARTSPCVAGDGVTDPGGRLCVGVLGPGESTGGTDGDGADSGREAEEELPGLVGWQNIARNPNSHRPLRCLQRTLDAPNGRRQDETKAVRPSLSRLQGCGGRGVPGRNVLPLVLRIGERVELPLVEALEGLRLVAQGRRGVLGEESPSFEGRLPSGENEQGRKRAQQRGHLYVSCILADIGIEQAAKLVGLSSGPTREDLQDHSALFFEEPIQVYSHC